MDSLCEQIQSRLLDSPGQPLNARDSLHVQSCPACRDVVGEAQTAGRMMAALARETDRRRAKLEPALKERVRRDALTRLEAEQAMGRPESLTARWLQWMGGGPQVGRRLAWAVASAAAVALVAVMISSIKDRHPVGGIDYASGLVRLDHGSIHRTQEGLSDVTFRPGASIHTTESSRGLIHLGKQARVRVAMATSTRVRIRGQEEIALDEGTVWLRIKPGAQGFRINTPDGRVLVTGTVLGVTAGDGRMLVEVTDGKAIVSLGSVSAEVEAGEAILADSNALGAPAPRAAGSKPPAWVAALMAEEKKAQKGSYIPSLDIQ